MDESVFIFLFILTFLACTEESPSIHNQPVIEKKVLPVLHTKRSSELNEYIGFDSPAAINRIADIENEYFENRTLNGSRYYGTQWEVYARGITSEKTDSTLFEQYYYQFEVPPDSMHCTIYAIEGLKQGFRNDFENLDLAHQKIWGKREYAGWSIGYLLVSSYNWKAYLIIERSSLEYGQCVAQFNKTGEYPVWRQPNIPLSDIYIIGEDDSKIDSLLNKNEFGWGFSYQGIHTWISRYSELKECNWLGTPLNVGGYLSQDLFITTPFLDYKDYASHVVIFPPKESITE